MCYGLGFGRIAEQALEHWSARIVNAWRDAVLVDRSGQEYPLEDPRWRGDDGSPLRVSAIRGLTPDAIDRSERSIWRYRAALPVDAARRISLGEGCTPLVPAQWNGHQVRFKLEWFNPTGSFKDRGASVMLSHLAGQGVTRVLEDSSGNGGAAVAAYAAAAGIAAKIIVPEATSAAKILQSRAYGAEIELVGGTRDQVSDEAIRQSETHSLCQPQLASDVSAGDQEHRL